MTTAIEGEGLRHLQRDIRLSGIVRRAAGESFEQFCSRIAAEYYLKAETAREVLEQFS